jgi:hypothetical protein
LALPGQEVVSRSFRIEAPLVGAFFAESAQNLLKKGEEYDMIEYKPV